MRVPATTLLLLPRHAKVLRLLSEFRMKAFFHGNTVFYIKGKSARVTVMLDPKEVGVVLSLLILRFVWHFLSGSRAMVSVEGSV